MDIQQVFLLLKILSLTEATYYVREYFFSYPFQRSSLSSDYTGVTIYNPNAFKVNINARTPFINFLDTNATIQPEETEVISTVGDFYQMDKRSGIYTNGILISSTADVIVFASKIISRSRDGFVVPASIHAGKKFVSVTAFASPYFSFLAVCTTHDDTLVKFILPPTFTKFITYEHVSYGKAQIFYEELSKFQCLQIVEQEDLTGISIESTKRITVLSGAENYKTGIGVQDYIVSNVPPLSSLGRFYVIQPLGNDLIKIVSTVSKSFVSIHGNCLQKEEEITYVQEGREYQIDCLISISASNPIIVAHFPMPPPRYNPAMYIATPMENYRESIMVYTPVHTLGTGHKCTIFVTCNTTNVSTILVKANIPHTSSWTRIQNENYDYAYIKIVVTERLIKLQGKGLTLGGYVVCHPSDLETAAVPFVATTYPLTIKHENCTHDCPDISTSFMISSTFDSEGMTSSTVYDQNGTSAIGLTLESIRPVIYTTSASTFSTVMEKFVSVSKTISLEQSVLDDSRAVIYSSYIADDYFLSSKSRLQIPSASSMYIKNMEPTRKNYSQKECDCDKPCTTTLNSSQEFNETSVKEIIEKLRQELSVNKMQTSTWVRSKISADDNRPSAKRIGGTLCLITVCVVFGVIIVPDIITLSNHVRQMLKKQKDSAVV